MDIVEFVGRHSLRYKGGAIRLASGHVANMEKLYTQYLGGIGPEETPMHKSAFTQELEGYLRKKIEDAEQIVLVDNPFPTIHTSDDLVKQATEFGKFSICPKGEKIVQHGFNATLEDLETSVIHHNNHYKQASKGPEGKFLRAVFSTEEVRIALKFFLRNRELKSRETLRESITFNPEMVDYTDQMVKYLLSAFGTKGDQDLNAQVFKQWIWQTKRYIFGLKVPSPIMINIMGKKQETGKTLLVRKLSEPMKNFYNEATLAQIIDPREAENWSSNYIVLFDELNLGHMEPQAFGRAMATFKFLLTAEEITHRVMRTTKHSKSSRTFSPISTSNETMVNVVYDPTGMRRFFELEMDCEPDKARIDNILGIQTLSFWAGINENLDKGFVYPGSETYHKMSTVQDSYKRLESLDWALEYIDYDTMPVRDDEIKLIESKLTDATTLLQLKQLLKGTAVEIATMIEIRKRVSDWVKEELGQDQVKYIPSGMRFLHALSIRGYCVYGLNGRDPRILCKRLTERSAGGTGIGVLDD